MSLLLLNRSCCSCIRCSQFFLDLVSSLTVIGELLPGNSCYISCAEDIKAAVLWLLHTGKNLNFRKVQEYTTGTTFEPNIYKKRVYEEVTSTMGFSNSKNLKQSKWTVDDVVEIHPSKILFYWKLKKVTVIRCK